MLEKRFAAVPAQSLIADGTVDGIITIANTRLFKVKQEVYLSATALPNLDKIEVKRVLSANQLMVGPKGGSIRTPIDVSAYTLAAGATIAANEQDRPAIGADYTERATYEEEPVVARRVILVDEFGNKYNASNPLPVEGGGGSGGLQYDKILITRDTDGDITRVQYQLASVLQEQLDLKYDSNKDLIEVDKS